MPIEYERKLETYIQILKKLNAALENCVNNDLSTFKSLRDGKFKGKGNQRIKRTLINIRIAEGEKILGIKESD